MTVIRMVALVIVMGEEARSRLDAAGEPTAMVDEDVKYLVIAALAEAAPPKPSTSQRRPILPRADEVDAIGLQGSRIGQKRGGCLCVVPLAQ